MAPIKIDRIPPGAARNSSRSSRPQSPRNLSEGKGPSISMCPVAHTVPAGDAVRLCLCRLNMVVSLKPRWQLLKDGRC